MKINNQETRGFVVHGWQDRTHTMEQKESIRRFIETGEVSFLEDTQYHLLALDMFRKEQNDDS